MPGATARSPGPETSTATEPKARGFRSLAVARRRVADVEFPLDQRLVKESTDDTVAEAPAIVLFLAMPS
jgi:hypothetical protein